MKMIDKDTVVAEIKRYKHKADERLKIKGRTLAEDCKDYALQNLCGNLLHFLDTLEVKDPYEQCIQYPNIKDGIKAHAETYSFNIESELFQQLTEEQQKLWRKEIEQACISGGYAGVELAKDPRYKKSFEVKEVDLDVQDIYGILYLERIVMRDFGDKEYSHEELCQEVLKRFNKERKEK